MSTDRNITFYSDNATRLAAQYDNVAVTDVHDDWLLHLPEPGMALDVGAGSGRDARFLASKGFSVVAVEPANGIREVAQAYSGADTECTEIQYSNTQHTQTQGSIYWLDDSLPELKQVFALQLKFDLILLSAVWMHIPASQRERALRKLSSLLKPSGRLIISLRHGACHDERVMHEVSADELAQLARQFGLSYRLLTPEAQSDRLGRDDVTWQTVMLVKQSQ